MKNSLYRNLILAIPLALGLLTPNANCDRCDTVFQKLVSLEGVPSPSGENYETGLARVSAISGNVIDGCRTVMEDGMVLGDGDNSFSAQSRGRTGLNICIVKMRGSQLGVSYQHPRGESRLGLDEEGLSASELFLDTREFSTVTVRPQDSGGLCDIQASASGEREIEQRLASDVCEETVDGVRAAARQLIKTAQLKAQH